MQSRGGDESCRYRSTVLSVRLYRLLKDVDIYINDLPVIAHYLDSVSGYREDSWF